MTAASGITGRSAAITGVSKLSGRQITRAEARRRLSAYLRNLLSSVERKNSWLQAEAASDAKSDGVQDFLSPMYWDFNAVRDDLQEYMHHHRDDANAMLVSDEPSSLSRATRPPECSDNTLTPPGKSI